MSLVHAVAVTETLVLNWQGPFGFRPGAPDSVFVGQVSAASGLYLWAVATPRGFLVQRIGATGKPFWQRHHEHLAALEQGEYPIHRAASLAAGRRDPIHPGSYGDRRTRDLLRSRFQSKRKQYQAELDRALSLLRVFLAPLPAGVRVRQRIRTALFLRLRARGGQEAAFLDWHRAKWHRFPGEAPVRVVSVAAARLRGVDGEFEC